MYRASIMNRLLQTQQQECGNACVIEYYESAVPSFIEAALDTLYGAGYAALAHFQFDSRTKNSSTYVARNGTEPLAIFLFRRQQGKVQVINESLQLSAMEIARFVDFVFMTFPAVSVVSFQAIHANLQSLRLPYQQTNRSVPQVHVFRSRRAVARHAGLILTSALRACLLRR